MIEEGAPGFFGGTSLLSVTLGCRNGCLDFSPTAGSLGVRRYWSRPIIEVSMIEIFRNAVLMSFCHATNKGKCFKFSAFELVFDMFDVELL